MTIDMTTLLLLEGIVLLAAFVQGTVGFAFGMISMGLGTYLLDARMASVLVAPLAASNIAIVLWSVRSDIKPRIVAPMIGGVLVGIPLGLMILLEGNVSLLRMLVGVLLIGIGVSRIANRRIKASNPSPLWGSLAGLVGGVLGGVANIAGPPLIAYAARQMWPPRVFKATLLSTFLVGTFAKTVLLIWHGTLDAPLMGVAAALIPAVLIGSLTGISLFNRIDQARFGRIVAVMLVVLGIGLLL